MCSLAAGVILLGVWLNQFWTGSQGRESPVALASSANVESYCFSVDHKLCKVVVPGLRASYSTVHGVYLCVTLL